MHNLEKMRVCFVGVGSIAKRHIRNLRTICDERKIDLTVDAFRRQEGNVEGIDSVFTQYDQVPNNYDAIFITNPTDHHLEALKLFHNNGKNFFVEKPVVALSQIADAEKMELRDDAVYYVASPLRYNAVIQFLKDNIRIEDVISVRSISSSYLPNWRPGQDYRQVYSAHKEMGGGVSIDLIHEWDYLTFIFGWPQKIKSFIGKKSKLEIDSDDYALYIAEYANMVAELHLDYFGRKSIREVQIFTGKDTIVGDLLNQEVYYLCSEEKLKFYEERDDYQKRELDHFLDLIEKRETSENGYWHGLRVLKLTQGELEG